MLGQPDQGDSWVHDSTAVAAAVKRGPFCFGGDDGCGEGTRRALSVQVEDGESVEVWRWEKREWLHSRTVGRYEASLYYFVVLAPIRGRGWAVVYKYRSDWHPPDAVPVY